MPSFNGVDPNIMRMEVRHVNYNQPPKPRKLSFGARLASAVGGFLGPIGLAAGLFFPPAAIGGLAAYGLKAKADQALNQQKAYINAEQQMYAPKGPQATEFIGFNDPVSQGGPQIQQVAGGPPRKGVGEDEMMNVLFLRHNAADHQIHNANYGGQ